MGILLLLIILTLGVLGGGGEQALHSDVTFQFISANGKGPSCGGNLSILSTAGSCVMKFMLSGQGNKVIATLNTHCEFRTVAFV